MAGLTIRCLTNLATPRENWLREQESNLRFWLMRPHPVLGRRCSIPASNWLRRRDSNSYHLVYKTSALEPIELRRKIGGLGGIQTLTRSLQDFYAVGYITSPETLVAVGEVEPPTSRL